MASFVLGATAYGETIAYGATYFAFYDYMKPAIRLAALMNLPTIYLFSHDSIGLGADGPTHQPVEQLASLRATPNMVELRPCDAREVIGCWRYLLRRDRGPAALILSRQDLTTLAETDPQSVEKGAYIIRDGEAPEVTLVATGSEVHLALEASEFLEEQGVAVRVVSMPSMTLFSRQSEDYQESILGPCPRLAVEAGSPLGWHRWCQDTVCLDTFGLTGPGPGVMKLKGFTAENVVRRALRLKSLNEA